MTKWDTCLYNECPQRKTTEEENEKEANYIGTNGGGRVSCVLQMVQIAPKGD